MSVGDLPDRVAAGQVVQGLRLVQGGHHSYCCQVRNPIGGAEDKILQRWDQRRHNFTNTLSLVQASTGLARMHLRASKLKEAGWTFENVGAGREQMVSVTATNQLLPGGGFLCLDAAKEIRLQKCTEIEDLRPGPSSPGHRKMSPVNV